MTRSHLRAVVFSVLASFAAPALAVTLAPLTAQAAGVDAIEFLKGRHRSIEGLLQQAQSAGRDASIDQTISGLIDYAGMAKAALGKDEWEKRSPDERQTFTDLLRQLIVLNYRNRLSLSTDYRVDYTGEDALNDAKTDFVVHTEVANLKDPRAEPVKVDYVLHGQGGGYIVVDVQPEGASMVRTYHKEFTKVLAKDGWDGLLTKMRSKKDELSKA